VASDVRAVTRRLTAEAAESAYRRGLFPMAYPEEKLITWHQPRMRAILPLDAVHVPRSLARRMRRGGYQVTVDREFPAVMAACADRDGGSWINDEFISVYSELQRQGKAHSLEVWIDGAMAGGIYGVHLGAAFFAESMFHRVTDMSKVALVELATRLGAAGFQLLEVQYLTPHLAQFGAMLITHREYLRRLERALAAQARLESS
jgi:leucyl/phenylalanyl-tRNA--protein transferase